MIVTPLLLTYSILFGDAALARRNEPSEPTISLPSGLKSLWGKF